MFSSINISLSTDRLVANRSFLFSSKRTQHRYCWFKSSTNALASKALQDSWGLSCLWIRSHTLLSSEVWIKECVFQDLSAMTLFLPFWISLFWIREAPGKQRDQVWRSWRPEPVHLLDSSLGPVQYWLADLGRMAYLLWPSVLSLEKHAICLCGWMFLRTIS